MIPYDEMRRLCGLPDVKAYVLQRDLVRGFQQLAVVAQGTVDSFNSMVAAIKPKHVPPMWAHNPTKTRRTN